MKTCSLLVELLAHNDSFSWRILHRSGGNKNASVAGTYQFPQATSPEDIYAQLTRNIKTCRVAELIHFGVWAASQIIPYELSIEIARHNSGDILFIVPPRWADIPLELLYIADKPLGHTFYIGTILKETNETVTSAKAASSDTMLILADPAQNLESSYKEGITLNRLAASFGIKTRMMAEADKDKLHTALTECSIFHFAGHSRVSKQSYSSGWVVGSRDIFDVSDIARLGLQTSVPAIVFSNSCNAGEVHSCEALAGIANAFLHAGVSQVIGPVTKVNDAYAQEFAQQFYRYLFKGFSPAKALCAAKQVCVEKNKEDFTPLLYRLFGDPLYEYVDTKKKRYTPKIDKWQKSRPLRVVVYTVGGIVLLTILLFFLFCPVKIEPTGSSARKTNVKYKPPDTKQIDKRQHRSEAQ